MPNFLQHVQTDIDTWRRDSLESMKAASTQFRTQAQATNCAPFIRLAELIDFYLKLCEDTGANFTTALNVTREQLVWINRLLALIFVGERSFIEDLHRVPLHPNDMLESALNECLHAILDEVNGALSTVYTMRGPTSGFEMFPTHLIACLLHGAAKHVGDAATVIPHLKDPDFGPDSPYGINVDQPTNQPVRTRLDDWLRPTQAELAS